MRYNSAADFFHRSGTLTEIFYGGCCSCQIIVSVLFLFTFVSRRFPLICSVGRNLDAGTLVKYRIDSRWWKFFKSSVLIFVELFIVSYVGSFFSFECVFF